MKLVIQPYADDTASGSMRRESAGCFFSLIVHPDTVSTIPVGWIECPTISPVLNRHYFATRFGKSVD